MAQRPQDGQEARQGAVDGCVCRATLPEVADRLGRGVRTLRRYQSEGLFGPVVEAAGRTPALYDLAAVARVLLTQEPNARDRKDNAVAALSEARLKILTGEWMPTAKIAKETDEAGRALWQRVQAIPTRLGAILAAEGDAEKVADRLEEELRQTFLSASERFVSEAIHEEAEGEGSHGEAHEEGDDGGEPQTVGPPSVRRRSTRRPKARRRVK